MWKHSLLMALALLSSCLIVASLTTDDFLVTKWKMLYKFLDVNHDGIISLDDVKESKNIFLKLHQLEGVRKTIVMVWIEQWWTIYIFLRREDEIPEAEFVEALSKFYAENTFEFYVWINNCFNNIFDVADINIDGFISEREFLLTCNDYGHNDDTLNTKFFEAYNPVDGLVPMQDIVASWVDFATSSDDSKESVVKTALESGL